MSDLDRLFRDVEKLYEAGVKPLELFKIQPPRPTGDAAWDAQAMEDWKEQERLRKQRIQDALK